MLALLINGHKNEFIFVKGKKVRKDFGPGELESGIMFKKDDVLYSTVDFDEYLDTLVWELVEEDDSYTIHNGSCWMFKERGSLFGSIITQIFENKSIVDNLF